MSDSSLVRRVLARALQAMGVGETVERGSMRIHRYRDHYVVWDLTHAGQRGKKVRRLSLLPKMTSQKADEMLQNWDKTLQHMESFDQVLRLFRDIQQDFPDDFTIDVQELRGIDVMPAGTGPIKTKTPFVEIEASPRDFTISDLIDTDNRPKCIPVSKGGQKSIAAFYRWVQDHGADIPHMHYRDILEALRSEGIQYHDYCAMD